MKSILTMLGILAAAALAWYGVHTWRMNHAPPPHGSSDALAWVQREFGLTNAQFAEVKKLHEAYEPRCMEMCAHIAEANGRVESLLRESRRMTPELAEAIRAAQQRRAECQTAMLTHLYETAAQMPPEAGQRYFRTVTARLLEDGHCISDLMAEKP